MCEHPASFKCIGEIIKSAPQRQDNAPTKRFCPTGRALRNKIANRQNENPLIIRPILSASLLHYPELPRNRLMKRIMWCLMILLNYPQSWKTKGHHEKKGDELPLFPGL